MFSYPKQVSGRGHEAEKDIGDRDTAASTRHLQREDSAASTSAPGQNENILGRKCAVFEFLESNWFTIYADREDMCSIAVMHFLSVVVFG